MVKFLPRQSLRARQRAPLASCSAQRPTLGGFTLVELMVVVAIIAILAVVAMPQFQRYMRVAKAAEATSMIDVMRKGAAAYYAIPHVEKTSGKRQPCQFPTSVGLTPVGNSCCEDALDKDNDERCDANPAAWDQAQWSALRFALTDAHYFQYAFESSGSKAGARYVGSAFGDMDCDNLHSTFEIASGGDPNATEAECDSVSGAAFFRDNETE